MEIVVFAAHADDEVLGMGGTIKKLSKNNNIHLCVATDSASAQYSNKKMILVRKNSCKKAAKILGISTIDFLDFPDMKLDTIEHLELNKKIVGSIGNIKYFGYSGTPPKTSKLNLRLKKIIRKQDVDVLEKHVMNSKGDYNKKVNEYLRFNQGSFVHGVFHTNAVQKNIIDEVSVWDLVFILNILKFGDLHVIDKILIHKFSGGLSSKGIIHKYKRGEITFFEIFFPISFYNWCKKNIGLKFLVKNLDWFLFLGIFNTIQVIKEIKCKKY